MKIYYYHRKSKKRYDITPYTRLFDCSGGVDRFYQVAIIELTAAAAVPYDTGERIRVYSNKKLIFEGRVMNLKRNGNGDITLTCYDACYYLFRSETSVATPEITLSDLFKRLAEEVGLKVGYVAKTTKKHFGLEFAKTTMQDILQTVMGLERAETKKRYYVRAYAGRIELRERGAMSKCVVISKDVTSRLESVLSAEKTYTVIDYENQIDSGTKSNGDSETTSGLKTVADYKGPDKIGNREGIGSSIQGTDEWNEMMVKYGKKEGIDPLFLKTIMAIESGGGEKRTGPPLPNGDHAYGLFQIVPSKVGTKVDVNRLLDGEYNMKKSIDIMLKEKGNIAKGLGKKMSVKEMAHFWVGYSQGSYALGYVELASQIYAGFGGDPDSLITDPKKIPTGSAKKKSSKKKEIGFIDDFGLGGKLGIIKKYHTGQYPSKHAMDKAMDLIQKELMREERTVEVEMPGHQLGIAGRKVAFEAPIATTKGTWYIKSHRHTFDQYGHKMNLTLSKYDETPEPEYETPTINPIDQEPVSSVKGTVLPMKKGTYDIGSYRFKSRTYYNPRPEHAGIDLLGKIGTPLYAVTNMMIVKNYRSDTYGWCVIGQGSIGEGEMQFLYAHMNNPSPHKLGSAVKVGEKIGELGNTGTSTDPHLHFEVCKPYWVQGIKNKLDPEKYFDF